MGWREEQRQRDEALAADMSRILDALEDLKPKVVSREPGEPAPHAPSRLNGLAIALRFCRDDEESLASLVRPVPREHREGRHGLIVNCLCGARFPVDGHLRPCSGDCGRWMAGDESGVWSVKLPAAA